eukprot:s384_g4.t3
MEEELQDLCRRAANGEFPLMKQSQYEPPVPVTNFDPNAMSFDPNAVSFDPNAMSFDPKAVSFDPKAVSFDPKAVSFDPKAVSFDPKAVSFDPKAVSFDPNATMFDPNSKVGYDFLPTVPEVVSPPKPSPVLSLTSLVAAPVPMPVGPVRQQDDKGGYQWQASSEKLLNRFEKTISGSTEKITIDDWMPSKLDEHVKLRLHYACSTGFLLKDEQNALQKTLNSLVSYVPEEQRLVIQKFLSPSFDDFRAIVNKLFWLQRCMEYCRSSSSRTERITPDSAQEKLLMALDLHGLRESALSDECWTTFEMFPPPLQDMVVQAVKASLPMKTEKKQLSMHFSHLAVNEESIYNLEASWPDDEVVPTQASWEAFSDSQYHELLRQLLVNSRNAEEKVLQLLSEEAPGTKANPSLLHVHLATQEARRGRSAEVISLLHAAAACGLSRLCARFIAEGLDVNERTGHQHFSPLHLAASNGNVRATETLLGHGAFPWLLDDSGKTPLYHVVTSLPESSEAEQQLLLQICQQLVFGMLQASDEEELLLVESALEILQQSELSWLLQLQYRMRELQLRNPAIYTPKILVELGRMHYETLNLLLSFFDGDRCKLNAPDDALPLEFAAAMKSDFIQEQEQLRRKVNILAKVLDLSKPVINLLAAMPLAAAEYAMKCFQLEERAPGVYAALLPEDKDGDGETVVEELPRFLNVRDDARRTTGRLEKWDSERGFGFIIEEGDTSEEPVNIFVHRTNLMGGAPGFPVDLQQGRRISFLPGFQDGRPRAMSAAMIDDEYNVDHVHLRRPKKPKGNEALKEKKLARVREEIAREDHPLSKSFLQFLVTTEVQAVVQDKRQEGEAWFRTLGLLKLGPGRRDDVLWRKEIDKRIDIFMEKTASPMTKKDMDFRCKRFLFEFCTKYNIIRVSEALAMVEKSTAGKTREEVRSWPAYVATLLRRFDPEVSIDRKPKAEAKKPASKEAEKAEEKNEWKDWREEEKGWKEDSPSEASVAEGSDEVKRLDLTAAPCLDPHRVTWEADAHDEHGRGFES